MISHNDNQLDTSIHASIEASIDAALARSPQAAIPVDFAARVRAALPPVTPARPRASAARNTAIAASAILLVGVFALAPHAAPSFTNLTFDVELSLLAELACILTWLAQPRTEL
jgi:hypothetical protein